MPDKPTVATAMTKNPVTVEPSETVRTAIERMSECKCRRLPVVQAGRLVGIISDRDLRRATNSPFVIRERWYDDFLLDHMFVGTCMTPDPVTVTPNTPLVTAAEIMRDRKFGGLPVVEGDHLVGIITETDLLNYLIRLLESW